MSKIIYFIGGAPRSGKTTTMKKLNERHPILSASTDAIRNVSKGMIRPEDNPKLFKVNAGNYASEEYQRLLKEDPEQALRMEEAQSEEVWKSVLDFIGYYQRDGKEAAVEGVAILPKELAKVDFAYKVVYVVAKNQTEAIIKHALEDENDWLNKYDENAMRAFCDFNILWNDYYRNEAIKYGFPIVEIEPKNFESGINKAVDILLS